MMRRNLYILAIASLLSGNYVFAQDAVKQWSLEECIQYAIEHNIDLKQKEQEQESRKVDLHTNHTQLQEWTSYEEIDLRMEDM